MDAATEARLRAVKGFNYEGMADHRPAFRCHTCGTLAAYTVAEALSRTGPVCLTCFPKQSYPTKPAVSGRRKRLPDARDPRPVTLRQQEILKALAAGETDLGTLGRRLNCSTAYVEKVYFAQYLVPKLKERVVALELALAAERRRVG